MATLKTELFDYEGSIHITTKQVSKALAAHRDDAERIASMIKLGLTHGLIEKLADDDARIWGEEPQAPCCPNCKQESNEIRYHAEGMLMCCPGCYAYYESLCLPPLDC